MAVRVIRPAVPEDMGELIKLCQEYCLQAYKGFDVLCNLGAGEEWAATFQQWLSDPVMRISLLYLDGAMMAFSAYRFQKDVQGEIVDLQYLPTATLADIQAMMETILKEFTGLDVNYVQVWVLRDNLRARFHYQQLGFKPVGGSREMLVGGAKLPFTRYIYCLKECPPDCI